MHLFHFLLLPAYLLAQSDLGFPGYSASSIANTAASIPNHFAPNTLISIYGVNLAFDSAALTAADVRNGALPTSLGATPVRVLLDGQFASLYYVSPRQVNALIPTNLLPGRVSLQVVLSGRAGPSVPLTLEEAAPGLFESGGYVIATHGNGPLITEQSPAAPGEVVVLYATGLGPTVPVTPPNRIPSVAAKLAATNFEVWLNGVPVPKSSILYAGVTPGFAGLFQINLQLPADAPAEPEIRVGIPDRMSPPGRFLRLRP